jgi:hypothetical protein
MADHERPSMSPMARTDKPAAWSVCTRDGNMQYTMHGCLQRGELAYTEPVRFVA